MLSIKIIFSIEKKNCDIFMVIMIGLSDREVKLLKEFGLDRVDPRDFPKKHKFVDRGIFIAVRGREEFKRMLSNEEFYVLTGIMPSYKLIHLGTYAVVESVKYFQDFSKITIIAIADIESLSTRNISLDRAREYAIKYHIPTYLALGLDQDKTLFYYQSENPDIFKIAGDVARKITINELKAIYGDIDPARIISSMAQVGDILFPQFAEKMLGLIPIGLDQDPHMRLCRDYIRRTDFFSFKQVASIYIRLIPGLDGSEKMSKSDPQNTIFLPEEDKDILWKKIWRAYSGGGPTVEEHRRVGGNIEVDIPFRLLMYLLDDDNMLREVAEKYIKGEMLSGELKKITFNVIWDFMTTFKDELEYFRDQVERGNINWISNANDIKSFM